MELRVVTVPAAAMTEDQTGAVVELCGSIFRCDYRSLLDLAPVRTHVLAYSGDRLVSHALWLDRPLRVNWGSWLSSAYVEGVATHPDYRGRGHATAVLRRLVSDVAGYDLAALSPADGALDLYARLGWELWQGPLYIEEECSVMPTPGERVLVHRTPRSGSFDLTASLAAPWRPFAWW